jgi:hypothetical protein
VYGAQAGACFNGATGLFSAAVREGPTENEIRAPLDERTWRAHAGRWIAARHGEIVASGERYYEALASLRVDGGIDPEECDLIAWVPEDEKVPFERWREHALAAGREFRRRLRG